MIAAMILKYWGTAILLHIRETAAKGEGFRMESKLGSIEEELQQIKKELRYIRKEVEFLKKISSVRTSGKRLKS